MREAIPVAAVEVMGLGLRICGADRRGTVPVGRRAAGRPGVRPVVVRAATGNARFRACGWLPVPSG
ncbi:hypothetical protein Sgou_27290 [Streptomyces gougerotii]|uniref:Uncharacterized protein n=2 Tax=Streptomyces diastaticus group TaxID=2849069 RepID=A0A8H9HRL3_9ACTN|nr:hypothetical protein Srut_08570 [Streptomyces rutgersensis]GFH69938.1 hypothetical protein Sdia_07060 [Streptomyces diastaticus subsp. diastaticus]GFH78059.1 hypothetical protein Sgou_27290 [Streptomyces gougerotii]GGU37537.1 hypothetical protein GCM10015534_45190 [Streptomyces diastaticus subsp. diastaticus]GGU80931.1 hypothetical protein GCM10010227_39160 [Streptomyces gougerotii]